MVDVAHDGDDRGARLEERRVVLLEEDLLGRLGDRPSPRRRHRRSVGGDGLGHLVAELAATSDAVSRSMSWLMVAKMPLLISSRMMSATLTPSSSASSLTMMVAGQLDRAALPRIERPGPPRECAVAARRLARAASAAGAAPTPGHGLLLRWSSWWRPRPSASRGSAGSGVSSARLRAPLVMAWSGRRRRADIGAAAGEPTRRVEDDAPSGVRTIAHELTLRTDRPAGDAGPRRDSPRGDGPRRAAPTTPPPRWHGRSSSSARFGLAAAAVSRRLPRPRRFDRRGRVGGRGTASGSAAAFFVARFGLAAGASAARPARPRSAAASARAASSRAAASAVLARRPPAVAARLGGRLGRLGLGGGVGRGLGLGDGHVAADVDPPAGQPRREPGVLALTADGQRQHPLGDGHARDAVLLVDVDAR